MTNGKEIAEITMQQLGGYGKLKAFVNARNLTYDEKGTLRFQFSGSKKANIVKISLNSMDLYDLTFYKLGRNCNVTEVGTIEGIYNDQLVEIFEHETGLYLHF